MKYSVFTVMIPDLNIEQTAVKLKELGFDGVEWRISNLSSSYKPDQPFNFWANRLEEIWVGNLREERNRLKQVSEDNGLEICALAGYSGCGQIDEIKILFESAREMGCGMVRVGTAGYDGKTDYNELFKATVEKLKKVEEVAKEFKVKALLETHMGLIAPSMGLMHRLISNFDSRHFGIIFDPGNMVVEGYENYKMGLELAKEYVAHVHVKNMAWVKKDDSWAIESVPVPDGIAKWEFAVRSLNEIGYDGYLSFEDFSAITEENTTEIKLRRNIEYIKNLEKKKI